MRNKTRIATICIVVSLFHQQAYANGLGENGGWQFQTTAEQANKAYIEDMRVKRVTGFYSSPQYNTYVDTQFNCTQNSSSSGNGGTNSASANNPSASAPTSTATGNLSTSSVTPANSPLGGVLNSGQDNGGPISSGVWGSSGASSDFNDTYQALNTLQDNSGTQVASINGSSACSVIPASAASVLP